MSTQQLYDDSSEFATQEVQVHSYGREHRDRHAQMTPQMQTYRKVSFVRRESTTYYFSFFFFAENQLASQAHTRQVRADNQKRRTQPANSQQVYRGVATPAINTASLQMATHQNGDLYSSQTQYSSYGGSATYNSADQLGQGKLATMTRTGSTSTDMPPPQMKMSILVSDGLPSL